MYRYAPHPGSPWVAEAVARAMAYERHGTPVQALAFPEDPDERAATLEAIAQHRVVEVVSPHLEALGVDGETARIVRAWRTQLASAGLRLVLDTNSVSSMLSTAGIEHLVFKGVALAGMLGLDPTQRGAGDIDILVRPDDVARTEALLHDAGWSRFDGPALPRPQDGWRWRVLLAATNELGQRSEASSSVDVHWRLTPWSGEAVPAFDAAHRRSVPAPGLANGVRTLCPADALVHLAQHARKDVFASLRHLVDIVRAAGRCDPAELGMLGASAPNVALALAVAEHVGGPLAPQGMIDERIQRLAREAWWSCLGLRSSHVVRRQATGRDALVVRARYESWMVRSAPTWRARASWAGQLAIPRRWLVRGGRLPAARRRSVDGSAR